MAFSQLAPPMRTLMGPGPSPVAPSVLGALARPTLGHLDPLFLTIMDEVRAMLAEVFATKGVTFAMSGTGSAGMETVIVNLVEPGDRVLVGQHGVFGGRLADVARRARADVTLVEGEWGRALSVEALRSAARGMRFKLLCVVHAETSTGVLQPLEPFRKLADELGALLVVDAVTSLGGVALRCDQLGIDVAYSGTQKCLSCPPGLSPVAFGERAQNALRARTTPVQSWYLDLTMIEKYWGVERAYHHTAPINMIYALHEALRLVLEEGLETRFARHERMARALWAGLEAMGLELVVPEDERLPPLTTVRIPEGADDLRMRRYLLDELGLEIGGGLGPMKGRVFRIGLMGEGARQDKVMFCLTALGLALKREHVRVAGDALAAAAAALTIG
jgi:alanine-glyoxylate transaminase/serine-glyoxylate transaminase/serine-pyruvate transaminase